MNFLALTVYKMKQKNFGITWLWSALLKMLVQINNYHKLLKDLKSKNITLLEEFFVGLLIEKLPSSWYNYKQQLKHNHKQLSLVDLITHIILKDNNRKEAKITKRKEITTLDNLANGKPKRGTLKKHKLKTQNHVFKEINRYKHKKGRNDNPSKLNVDLVEEDDIIVVIISQVNIVTNMKEWVIDSSATSHICSNQNMFVSYSRTTNVLEKDKVMLKLISRKLCLKLCALLSY